MLYPSLIVDNFFLQPNLILDFASKQKFYQNIDGRWPGKRTEALHINNFSFFDYINKKIIAALYPNDKDLYYAAETYFQKISGKRYPNYGWIHKDESELTGIIYLSKHKLCGTSLCERISFDSQCSDKLDIEDFGNKDLVSYKKNFYTKDQYDPKELEYLKINNKNYRRTLTIDSKFNRLFLFDSSNLHMAESFTDKNLDDDRLTIITFINNIGKNNKTLKLGVTESRRLD